MSPPKHHSSATGATPPEKSKFLQTCNRLSLFLKEKGKIPNLNAKFDATGNGLFESVISLNHPNSSTCQPTTVDLLSTIGEKPTADVVIPEYVILDSSCCCCSEIEIEDKSAQMTIFYQGQVLVLDDVPADRARDLMLMAKKGVIETSKPPPPVHHVDVDMVSRSSKEKEPAAAATQQAKDSDLPIARRASLHKFLAKRKDRAATVRAVPYQSSGGSSSGNEQQTFDLNL